MSRVLYSLLRWSAFRRSLRDNRTFRTTVTRNPGFVSFIAASGAAARRHPDRHDRRLQRQKLTRGFFGTALAVALAWIAVESAQALSIF
jgi:hypothetical protein